MMLKKIVNLYISSYAHRRVKEIRETYGHPLRLQEKALFSILDRARSTEFARSYDFKSIKSIDIFQKRLPLFRYRDMRNWIEKAIKGKPNILWTGRIWNFALTSGTTSGNKYIPISKGLLSTTRKTALDILSFYLTESGETSLLDGKFLFLGSSTSLERLKSGASAGDLSGIASQSVPLLIRSMFEPGTEIAHISDWEKKIDKIAKEKVEIDIRGISGIPSWLLVFFNKLIEEAGKRKGRTMKTVSEIWPDLSLLVHGGVNFMPYKEVFNELIGKEIYYLETYLASEACIAIQARRDEPGLLLMLDYDIFYEFVPEEEIEKGNPIRLTVAEVEVDKNYAIVITNNSGLYSYLLGDTVKFISLDPPKLVVTGRVENFLSAFGEHLIEEEADDAISYACHRTGAEIEEFTVAPFFQKSAKELPCHQWLIEFRSVPADIDEFTKELDERLRKRNDDYNAHRGKDISIGKPRVVALRKGAFYDWMKSEGKLGGQHKVPRLKNDRSIVDKLLPTGAEGGS